MTASPAKRPARATIPQRGGPSLSFISTQNAAKARPAEITCEKNSPAKVITTVARPRVIAAAVP